MDVNSSPSGHSSASEELDDDDHDELESSVGRHSNDSCDHASGGTQPTLSSSHSPLDVNSSPSGHISTSEELDDEDEEDK